MQEPPAIGTLVKKGWKIIFKKIQGVADVKLYTWIIWLSNNSDIIE